MRCTQWMHGNSCVREPASESAGRACMIEVNVSDKYPIETLDSVIGKAGQNMVDRGLRPRLNERGLVACYQERRSETVEPVHLHVDDCRTCQVDLLVARGIPLPDARFGVSAP